MKLSLGGPYRINLQDPLAVHPLTNELRGCWLVPPHLSGGRRLWDLCKRNHSTLTSFTTDGSAWQTQPNGFGAISLDNTDDYLDWGAGTGNAFDVMGANQSFSVVLVLNYTSADSDFLSLWHKGADGNSRPFQFFTSGSLGVVRFQQYNGSENPFVDSSNRGNDGEWHHWVAIRDVAGSSMRIYLDGTDARTGASDTGFSTNFNDAGIMTFGDARLGLNHSPAVRVGGLWLYSKALSVAEIKAHHIEYRRGFPNVIKRYPEQSWFILRESEAAATYTGTAALTTGAATLSSSATFSPGTKTAASALTVGGAALAASATFSPGTKTATAALSSGAATLSSAATFSEGTRTATAGLNVRAPTLAASATFSPGTKTATSALTAAPAALAASATFGSGTKTATAGLTVGAATAGASATFSPGTKTATAALSVRAPTLSASAAFDAPTYTAASALTVGAADLDATAAFAAIIRSAVAPLTVGRATLASAATFTVPVYAGTASLNMGAATLASSATFFMPTFTATAALTVGRATLASSATFTVPAYTATVALTVAPATLSASALFAGILRIATAGLTVGSVTFASVSTFSSDGVIPSRILTAELADDTLVLAELGDDTLITGGLATVAVKTNFRTFHGERLRLKFTDQDGINRSSKDIIYRLRENGYKGTVLTTKTVGDGITFPSATETLVTLAAADTRLDHETYYYTVSQQDGGEEAMLAYGTHDILSPEV